MIAHGVLTIIVTLAVLLPVTALAVGPSLVALIRQHHELRAPEPTALAVPTGDIAARAPLDRGALAAVVVEGEELLLDLD